jgi:serine protease
MTFLNNVKRFSLPNIYQGTSMASPHVSGTAALVIASGILGKNPSPAKLQDHLQFTASDIGAPGYDRHYGYGIVNAAKAVGATN